MGKFSVLISVYHREKGEYLRTALDSTFDQTVEPNEVILVKDGPLNDELDAVISDFESNYNTLKVVALPQNVGLGNALNEGLKHCSYELVARMDSDDICKPTRFERQLNVFASHPELAVVGSLVDEFEERVDNVVSIRRLPEDSYTLFQYATSRNPLNHPSVMFRKSAVENVGGYQHFYLFEDYYLWTRLLGKGYKFYNIQESLLYFRTSRLMVARRGGWKYAISEVKFFYALRSLGFISSLALMKNVLIRFPLRIMPNKLRLFVYSKMIR